MELIWGRKSEIERANWRKKILAIRKKNVGNHFLYVSGYLRNWLVELADKYKKRDVFPLMPMTLLPSYYEDVRDKEIAVFASALLDGKDDIVHRVSSFRELFDDRPWAWFEQRKFVTIAIGTNRYKQTGGVENWRIAKLFDKLWNDCFFSTEEEQLCLTNSSTITIEEVVRSTAEEMNHSYYDVLMSYFAELSLRKPQRTIRLMLLILSRSDGFSLGLWTIPQSELKCPLLGKETQLFLSTMFPNYRRAFSVDEAIALFGFERDCDFFYAYLGYKELQKRNPAVCSRFATIYLGWFDLGVKHKPKDWRKIIPDIEF